ncbi:hypothetical protein BJ742DRAFT_427091 [Cladochytrium replicatum]|nr:hypothetical protein BJ742DRAFT_427091 [Cladochytrium replicatum]
MASATTPTAPASNGALGDPLDFQSMARIHVLLDCIEPAGSPIVMRSVRNATINGTLNLTFNNDSTDRDGFSITSFDLIGTLSAAWHDSGGARSHNKQVAIAPISLTRTNADDPDTSVRRYKWRLILSNAGSLCPSFTAKLATIAYEIRLVLSYNAMRKMRITAAKTWPVILTESSYLVRTRISAGIPSLLVSTANHISELGSPAFSPISTGTDISTTSSSSSTPPDSPLSFASSTSSRRTSFMRLPEPALPTPASTEPSSPTDSRSRGSFLRAFKRTSATTSPRTPAGPPKRIPCAFLLKHRGIVAGYQVEGTLSWSYPLSHFTATPRLVDVALLCTVRVAGVVSQRVPVGKDFKIEFTAAFKNRTSQRVGIVVPIDSVPSINHPLVQVSYDLMCKIYLDGATKSSARIMVPVMVLPRARGTRFGITSTPRSDSIRTDTAQVDGEATASNSADGGERQQGERQQDERLFEVMYPYMPTRDDELKLSIGDQVAATEQSFDGYTYARIHSRRKTVENPTAEDNRKWGWCPHHHLSPVVVEGEVEHQIVGDTTSTTDSEGGEIDGAAVGLKPEEREAEKTYSCAICICEIDAGDFVVIDLCEHTYDTDCLYQAAMASISNSEVPVPCATCKADASLRAATRRDNGAPSDFVGGVVLDHLLARVFADDDWAKYYRASIRAAIGRDENHVSCPRADCPGEFLLVRHETNRESNNFVECPECKLRWCRECGTHQWHTQETCQEHAKSKRSAQAEIEMNQFLESNRMYSRCPNCRTLIEKTDGCNHITCTKCKYHFCLLCRTIIGGVGARNVYDHYSKQGEFPDCYGKVYADAQKEYDTKKTA